MRGFGLGDDAHPDDATTNAELEIMIAEKAFVVKRTLH